VNYRVRVEQRDGQRACHERLLSVCDPEAESRRAKALQGLIGPHGEDYTETKQGDSPRQHY